MKFFNSKNKTSALFIATSKQVLLFFLLISFLNTSLFPSLFLAHRQCNGIEVLTSESESCFSLTEYLLEDCLDIYDITPNSRKNDLSDIEELYDEVDLLNHSATNIHFWADAHKTNTYMQGKYPLLLSCFFSYNPPPEC
jgi:hypothetical protein